MKIKIVDYSDIPHWVELSKEYDRYILELVPNLTEWYEGNGDTSISFVKYIDSKISKGEAFMAIDDNDECRGIVAISIANNRITFLGVSLKFDFMDVGVFLLEHALSQLDIRSDITTNIVKSNAESFQKEHELFCKYGFIFSHDGLENGVPVSCMVRRMYRR